MTPPCTLFNEEGWLYYYMVTTRRSRLVSCAMSFLPRTSVGTTIKGNHYCTVTRYRVLQQTFDNCVCGSKRSSVIRLNGSKQIQGVQDQRCPTAFKVPEHCAFKIDSPSSVRSDKLPQTSCVSRQTARQHGELQLCLQV